MTERPANDEMIQGFRDGYDLSAPEPSANRSASYRHGFMCGRIDKGKLASPGIDYLNLKAEAAMTEDETSVERTPKVRTGHHRNAEEAARLQALVDKKYAEPPK